MYSTNEKTRYKGHQHSLTDSTFLHIAPSLATQPVYINPLIFPSIILPQNILPSSLHLPPRSSLSPFRTQVPSRFIVSTSFSYQPSFQIYTASTQATMKFLVYLVMAVLSLMTAVEAGKDFKGKPCYGLGGILLDCSTPPSKRLAKRQA